MALAVQVELSGGREAIRFGPDEADVRQVPLSADWDTEIPGGFGPAEISLPRLDALDPIPVEMLAGTRIYEAETNRTFHEGRIVGISTTASEIQLEIEGWARSLADDGTAREIFYDRDVSNWEGMSTQRKINLATASPSWSVFDASTTADDTTGEPALETTLNGTWNSRAVSEGWYDADGLDIAAIDFAWKQGANINEANTNWSWSANTAETDTAMGIVGSGNLRAAGPASGTVDVNTSGKIFGLLQLVFNDAQTAFDGLNFQLFWTLLGVVGSHGLPLQGSVSVPNNGRGVLLSGVAAHIVGTWGPLLNFTTGPMGSIEPTSFVIPHLVFREETTAADMLESLRIFGGNTNLPMDWGVYDNREFFMKSPGTYGRVWRARKNQAAESTGEGLDVQRLLNGVKVKFNPFGPANVVKSIGPPGSRSTVETEDLRDDDPANPANNDGSKHWDVFDAGLMTQLGAEIIGQMILGNAREQEWRGSVTLKGALADETGARFPVGTVRAGDLIVVEDSEDTRPRRIINTSTFNNGEMLTASVGAPSDELDVLLAKAGISHEGRL